MFLNSSDFSQLCRQLQKTCVSQCPGVETANIQPLDAVVRLIMS